MGRFSPEPEQAPQEPAPDINEDANFSAQESATISAELAEAAEIETQRKAQEAAAKAEADTEKAEPATEKAEPATTDPTTTDPATTEPAETKDD